MLSIVQGFLKGLEQLRDARFTPGPVRDIQDELLFDIISYRAFREKLEAYQDRLTCVNNKYD